MRTIITVLAVLEVLFGFLLLALTTVTLLVESPAMEHLPNLKVYALLFYGGTASWFLITAIRFFQKKTVKRALAVCRLASILFGLVLTLIAALVGGMLTNGSIAQRSLMMALPFIICGSAIAMHRLVLRPTALRAYQ